MKQRSWNYQERLRTQKEMFNVQIFISNDKPALLRLINVASLPNKCLRHSKFDG